MKNVEITKLENKVLVHLASLMYAEPGFTDINIESMLNDFDLNAKQLRGVLSSLVKKELITVMDDSMDRAEKCNKKGEPKPTAEEKRQYTFYGLNNSVFHLVNLQGWPEAGESDAVELIVKGSKPKPTETPKKEIEKTEEETTSTDDISTKVCRDCNDEYPLEDFYKLKIAKDGHHVRCKKCYNVLREQKKTKRELAKKDENSKI